MTAPKDITGPDDLAKTVRNATDPLEEYPNYGTSANPPGDNASRPAEMNELIDERGLTVSGLRAACEHYIAAHPMRSVAIAAGAGAAAAALLIAVADVVRNQRR
jgi:hypothetical protein